MKDIQKAKKILENGNVTCVLCRGDEIVVSQKAGISPMLDFLADGTDLRGFSAADKIVGRAAAMLFVLAGVCEVYGEVVSRAALPIFEAHSVAYSYGVLTERIINRKGDGLCPMEAAVAEIHDPKLGAETLYAKRQELLAHKM